MISIPILRKGEPYTSLDVVRVPHHRTREPFVEISQANAGLIRRDLLDQRSARAALTKFSTAELVEICARAADYFLNDALPLDAMPQSPDDYVRQVSATTGLPHTLARRNMQKIRTMLAEMGQRPSRSDQKSRLGNSRSRVRRVRRTCTQFFPARRIARGCVAEQFSRCSFTVDSGVRVEDSADSETGRNRTMDAFPHHSGVDSGRCAARGIQFLSRPITVAREKFCAIAAAA